MEQVICSYAKLVDVKTRVGLDFLYVENTTNYTIFCVDLDSLCAYIAIVNKLSSGAVDFEANHKFSATKYNSLEDAIGNALSISIPLLKRVGEVTANPTGNTILGRLKSIWDRLHDVVLGAGNNIVGKFKIVNDVGTNVAGVDSLGRLYVATTPPQPPANTTPISQGGTFYPVTKAGGVVESIWVVPVGVVLTMSEFVAGAYMPSVVTNNLQLKCELIYQPSGSAVGQIFVSVIYLHGQSFGSEQFSASYPAGNGTMRWVIRITNWSAKDVEVTVKMKGFTTP